MRGRPLDPQTYGESLWTEHERRFDRIEGSLGTLHKKLDAIVEHGAVARTEIAWLKWGMRLLFAAVLGVGGVAAQTYL